MLPVILIDYSTDYFLLSGFNPVYAALILIFRLTYSLKVSFGPI